MITNPSCSYAQGQNTLGLNCTRHRQHATEPASALNNIRRHSPIHFKACLDGIGPDLFESCLCLQYKLPAPPSKHLRLAAGSLCSSLSGLLFPCRPILVFFLLILHVVIPILCIFFFILFLAWSLLLLLLFLFCFLALSLLGGFT